ncbi:hypothetical protein Tco_0251849 [Tanacetum coccineum]
MKEAPKPPIKPHGLDSLRMKVVNQLTIHIPALPYVAYYHPGLGNPKKYYGFKPGLLGQSGSLGVDISKLETIKDDWELGFKEVSFLGRRFSLPVRPKEVEKVKIKETHHSEHIIQQPIFQHVTPSRHHERGDGVTIIKRRRQDLHRDGVRDSTTASGHGRLKEDLESSTWRRRHNFKRRRHPNTNSPPTNNRHVLSVALCTRAVQELYVLQVIFDKKKLESSLEVSLDDSWRTI